MSAGGANILVLCPLRFEAAQVARALSVKGIDVACIGPGERCVHAWFDEFGRDRLNEDSPRLILAGLAGGLDESVVPGRAYVVRRVRGENGRVSGECAEMALVGSEEWADVTSSAAIVRSAEERQELNRRTGARLVDQESAAFIYRATQAGYPWMIVRGVSDGFGDSLPKDMANWIDERGAVRIGGVVRSVARQPQTLRTIMRLRRQARRAMSHVAAIVLRIACERREGREEWK